MTDIDKVEKDIIRKITKVDNIFKIPSSKNMELIFEKNNDEEPFQKEMKERSELMKILEEQPNKDKIYDVYKRRIFEHYAEYIFQIFTNNGYFKNIILNNNNYKKNINKYNNINFLPKHTIKKNHYKEMSNNMKKYQKSALIEIIEFIKISYINLKKNGSCLFTISIPNIYIINILYFLTNLFDEIYILNKYIVFCKGFKDNKEELINIKKIEDNNYDFSIKPKKKENKLIQYLKKIIKIDKNQKKKLIIEKKINEYIFYEFSTDLYLFIKIGSMFFKNQNNIKKDIKDIFKKQYSNKLNLINNNKNNIYLNEFKNFTKVQNKIIQYMFD
jgi:hypothetical protein